MHNTNSIIIAHRDQEFADTITTYILDKYQITCKNTNDGFTALKSILKCNPKLVIIEANLPNLNATDIIRCINKKGHSITFIVITSDITTKLPCVSDTKKVKALPCHTQVIKIAYEPDNLHPLFLLIDQIEAKQQKILH